MKTRFSIPSTIHRSLARFVVPALCAVCGLYTPHADGALSLPIYDSYPTNYANNARLRDIATYDAGNSAGGGSNLTNSWTAGLTYPGLATSNNSGGIFANGVPSSGRDAGIALSPAVTLSATPNLYGSFLLKIQTTPSGTNLIALFSASTGGGNTPVAGVYLDQDNKLWISKSSATPVTNTPSALSVGDTHLIVFRYKYSASTPDEVALWVDPGSLSVDESSVPAPTIITTNGSDASSIAAFDWAHRTTTGISASGFKYFDELRIAVNWADVTPISCTAPGAFNVTGGGAYCAGGSGVSVGLSGSEVGIEYQLKLNGTAVGSPALGTGLAVDFGLQTAGGTYTVTGSNVLTACRGAMTGNAVVTVNTAPAISGNPTNITVCENATATFNVTATGTGLTYQWQVNPGSGFVDVSSGTGGTASNYTTAALSAADNDNQYRCVVGGTCSPSATSGSATVSVSAGADINSNPVDRTVSLSSTATLTVGASGPGLVYQWQFSTDGGANYNNVTTGTGGTSANYTTAALGLADSGTKYRCTVSAACGLPAQSAAATVTVLPAVYRSFASGTWHAIGSWEQSYDSGGSWVSATTSPNADNTAGITVQSGHTLVVSNALSVDDLVVQANAEVDINGVTLTVNDNTSVATDAEIAGTLKVAGASSGSVTVAAGATLRFGSGGKFIWNNSATVGIPTATWADGSTCEVQNGSTTTPTGLGQNFYDFYWNKTNSGSVNLGGTLTTIRNNLRMRGSTDPASSVRFLGAAGTSDLRVGNDVVLESGYITLSGGSAANTVLNWIVGGNFVINSAATLDSRTSGTGSSANILFTNAASTQYFTNLGAISHTGSGGGCPINWKVLANVHVVIAAGNIVMFSANNGVRDSVTVDGTLEMGTQLITGAGNLELNAGSTLLGNGTNQLTIGLTNTTYGGTLNLGALPTLTAGQSFKLFDSLTFGGAFSSIVPSTPGQDLSWDTSQLTVNGTLVVANISNINTNPINITSVVSGGALELSWPADHTGWRLEGQTNAIANLGTNWQTVPGSASTNRMIFPIDPVHGSVFHRLVYP